jgi:hypothetical protein
MTASDLYSIWYKISIFRDLAKNIFHGSVLCDILDNASSLKYFAIIGKSICGTMETKLKDDNLWESFKAKGIKQAS